LDEIQGEGGTMSLIKRLFGLDVASYLQRAEKYEEVGKLGMARLELERALEIASLEDVAQREQINRLLDRISAKEQDDAESRAQEALQKGNRKEARYYLNVALSKLEEGSPKFHELKNRLDSIPEDIDEAKVEDELDTVLKAEVGVDFLDRQRTLEFWKSGFPPYKEEYYFKKALTSDVVLAQAEQVGMNPEDADACFNFAVTLAQLGLTSKALEQIRRFVSLRPEDRDGHYFLANLLADQGYDDEAIREFEKAISIDPDFMEAYFYLAEHYSNLGDLERAQKLFVHMIEQAKESELAEEARLKLEAIRAKRNSAKV
jgi:tetratricopeptide (TPR) repeat protein